MARPNKGQHKIPSTYLEAFTDTEGHVWTTDQSFNLFPQKPKHTLVESDYYTIRFKTGGGTLDIETKFLGGVETRYAEIYKNKLDKKILISQQEKAILSVFVASMMERPPLRRESLKKFFSDVKEKVDHLKALSDEDKEKMSRSVLSSGGPSINADEFLKMGEDIGSLHSSLIPENVRKIAPIIFNMKWLFIVRPSDSYPYITSDHPCIMVDPVAEIKYGVGTMGAAAGLAYADTEITLPLSSNLALMCRWEATKDCVYGQLDAKFVQEVNSRTMRGAKVLIGSDKYMLERIIKNVKLKKEKIKNTQTQK